MAVHPCVICKTPTKADRRVTPDVTCSRACYEENLIASSGRWTRCPTCQSLAYLNVADDRVTCDRYDRTNPRPRRCPEYSVKEAARLNALVSAKVPEPPCLGGCGRPVPHTWVLPEGEGGANTLPGAWCCECEDLEIACRAVNVGSVAELLAFHLHTDRFLARIADLIRRTGVDDAETLIVWVGQRRAA